MAQKGVKCVRGFVLHDDCRACATEPLHPCGQSADILEAMRENPDDRHADPDAFSPTTLLDCDRKHALSIGQDWFIDIESGWKMLRGSLVHSLVESYVYPGAVGVIRETEMMTRVQTAFGEQRMHGKPDVVVVKKLTQTDAGLVARVGIIDYKSTHKIGHDLTAARRDHIRQVNMYAWLVRRWLPTHYNAPLIVEVEELVIQYVDFDKARRFTSAGPLKARGKRIGRSGSNYETLDLEPLPIYPDDEVDARVVSMIEDKLLAREVLPPAYSADDPDYWRCYNCPVRAVCKELTEQGL